jgi:hypothetical protein
MHRHIIRWVSVTPKVRVQKRSVWDIPSRHRPSIPVRLGGQGVSSLSSTESSLLRVFPISGGLYAAQETVKIPFWPVQVQQLRSNLCLSSSVVFDTLLGACLHLAGCISFLSIRNAGMDCSQHPTPNSCHLTKAFVSEDWLPSRIQSFKPVFPRIRCFHPPASPLFSR